MGLGLELVDGVGECELRRVEVVDEIVVTCVFGFFGGFEHCVHVCESVCDVLGCHRILGDEVMLV